MTIELELDRHQAQQLNEVAARLNVTVAELAKSAISEMLDSSHAEFDKVAARVLEKNAELYRRLAQ